MGLAPLCAVPSLDEILHGFLQWLLFDNAMIPKLSRAHIGVMISGGLHDGPVATDHRDPLLTQVGGQMTKELPSNYEECSSAANPLMDVFLKNASKVFAT